MKLFQKSASKFHVFLGFEYDLNFPVSSVEGLGYGKYLDEVVVESTWKE